MAAYKQTKVIRKWTGMIKLQLNFIAWRIPWTETLVSYCPWGHKESDATEQLMITCLWRPKFKFRIKLSCTTKYYSLFLWFRPPLSFQNVKPFLGRIWSSLQNPCTSTPTHQSKLARKLSSLNCQRRKRNEQIMKKLK